MTVGPITRNTSALMVGFLQIRVGPSASNIANAGRVLTAADSIGALAATSFSSTKEFFKHYSGFPRMLDTTIPLSEEAAIEAQYEEMTPYNTALAYGIDPTGGTYDETHSGEIPLGNLRSPDYVRMEADGTFPDGTHHMYFTFPRAQVTSDFKLDFQGGDTAKPTVMFTSNLADSNVSGGNAVWDGKPLGSIAFF
jgi:hypothetical protein